MHDWRRAFLNNAKIRPGKAGYGRGSLSANFVLVDFENVQPKNVGALSGRSLKIKVFAGASQSKVPLEMARALQVLGPDVEYLQIDGNGKNALDFHIAYYIGRLAAENPGASFFVISKDKGFDPLIKHLKAQGITCQRSSSIADIPGARISSAKLGSDAIDAVKPFDSRSMPEKVEAVVGNLAKLKAAKPRTLEALRSAIRQVFRKNGLAAAELEKIIEHLIGCGTLQIVDGKVTYEQALESKPANSEPISESVDAIIADLKRRKASRPKKLKTLRSTINALFKNVLSDAVLDDLVDKLTRHGAVKIADDKVSYDLP